MAFDPRFPVWKVNLVEAPTWREHWDPGGKIMDYASDHAYEEFHNTPAEDLEKSVDDLATYRTKGRKALRKFSSEEIEWISKRVKARDPRVEAASQAIVDALQWMYESAYMPHKADIEDAMEKARESVINNFSLNLDLWEPVLTLAQRRHGPKEWSPRKRFEEREVLSDLLKHVQLEQKEGHYDRFLVFDFRNSQMVKDLLSRSTWAEIDLVYALQTIEFMAIYNDYVIDFFSELKKAMQGVDISNRTNWKAAWRSMLESGVAPGVQKEMAAALKEMPADWHED